jgi:hypothetical protein
LQFEVTRHGGESGDSLTGVGRGLIGGVLEDLVNGGYAAEES